MSQSYCADHYDSDTTNYMECANYIDSFFNSGLKIPSCGTPEFMQRQLHLRPLRVALDMIREVTTLLVNG